jgi:hypothetical protein
MVSAWIVQMCVNLLSFAATASLYRALTVGRLSVVAPVAATYGGVSALLRLLAGERFSVLGWSALATEQRETRRLASYRGTRCE